MLSLVNKGYCIYSTDRVENLYDYILCRMTLDELTEAKEMFNKENKEYGGMWHVCLLEHCSKLAGYGLLIHKGEYNGSNK